jgi:hypothetical protein
MIMIRRVIAAARIFLAVLHEVFDEASYTRFLQHAQISSSREAYAQFWRERAQSHGRKQRCC